MSLGFEVPLQITAGNQGLTPMKSERGNAALADLFSAAMAMAMTLGAPIAPAAQLEPEVQATQDVLPALASLDTGAAQANQVVVGSPAQSPEHAASVWSAKAVAESAEPSIPAVLASMEHTNEAESEALRLVAHDARVLRAHEYAAQVPQAAVSLQDEVKAGADLPVLEAGEDVVPMEGVDAATPSSYKTLSALREAEIKARVELAQTERPAAAKSTAQQGAGPTQVSYEEEAGKDFVAASRLEDAGEKDESKKASRPGTASQDPTAEAAKAQPEEIVPVAELKESGAVLRNAKAEELVSEPAISLKDVRAVADLLREEALKKLPRSVEFRLDPPQLGKVTVLLSTRGQDVAVKFIAAAGEAQRELERASGDLAQALAERGLTLTGFAVGQGDAERGAQPREQSSTRSIGSRRAGHGSLKAASASAPVINRRVAGAFDYFV